MRLELGTPILELDPHVLPSFRCSSSAFRVWVGRLNRFDIYAQFVVDLAEKENDPILVQGTIDKSLEVYGVVALLVK